VGLSQLIPLCGTADVELSETHLSTTRRTTGTEQKAGRQGVDQNFFLGFPYPNRPRSDFYTSEATLRATHPCSKILGSEVTKTQILIAQNNLTISKEDFRPSGYHHHLTSPASLLGSRLPSPGSRGAETAVGAGAKAARSDPQAKWPLALLRLLMCSRLETTIARTEERILLAQNALRGAEDRLKRVMNFQSHRGTR